MNRFERACRIWLLTLLVVLLTGLVPAPAAASRPVITPGREPEIRALFAPHELGTELSPGWTLRSFSIDIATVHVWITGPDDAHAQLTLDHPDYGPDDARTLRGFALATPQVPAGSEAAIATLAAAIETNDDGSFWSINAVYADEDPEGAYLNGSALVTKMRSWLGDGLVLLGAVTLGLFGLVLHKLRGAEPWMKWCLLGIVVASTGLRLTLPVQTALAPWPYTRLLVSARLVFSGPGLAALQPDPAWLSEVITDSTLYFALLAPLAIYVHARYLLDDHRAALITAAVVAVLPLHLRFSHSDAAFIPSITMSSLVFTLIHIATRERAKVLAWTALLLVPFPLALMFMVRPLNIMYYPLLLATAFINRGLYTDKAQLDRVRAVIVFVLISVVTFAGGVPWLLEDFGAQVSEGLTLETLRSAIAVTASPRMNALLNPQFTPPGLTLLAVLGAVSLWRRERRPLMWFLVLWLLGFLAAHAYIVPISPYMQARYHLHLIVPYMLLVACGAEATLHWLAERRVNDPRWAGRRASAAIVALVAYVCASPLIHLRFIREVELNDVREWIFVHELREHIPAGCSIIEYTGENENPRFARVGAYAEQGILRSRWQVYPILLGPPDQPPIPEDVRALLEDPPECLYWYEGLPCFGNKDPSIPKAEVCDEIEGFVVLEEEAKIEFDSVPYDGNLAIGLGDRSRIPLTLYRVYRRPD